MALGSGGPLHRETRYFKSPVFHGFRHHAARNISRICGTYSCVGRISFEQLSGVCPVHDSPSGRPDEQQKRHVLQAIGPHITLMYAAAPRNALRMIDLIQPDAAKARGSRSPHAPQLKAPRLVRFRPSSGQVADSEIRQAAHNCRRGSLPARPNPSLARSRRRWNVT